MKTKIVVTVEDEDTIILFPAVVEMSKVRQALGTWKLWKLENLKTWKFENFENIKNDPWDMLNNFCFHVYAQKSLFIVENGNLVF